MAAAEPREIDWGRAEIDEGTLTVELTGTSSTAWKQQFARVLALLDNANSRWGEVRLTRKGIRVGEVQQGTEPELRHFLESVVVQANSELPQRDDPAPDEGAAG